MVFWKNLSLAGHGLSLTGFDEFELGELFAERTQEAALHGDCGERPGWEGGGYSHRIFRTS